MKIQAMEVAYTFPTIKALEQFLKINHGKIMREQTMYALRRANDDICFIFDTKCNGKDDWEAHTTWYTRKYYDVDIVTYGLQRTE